jgi:hypothetical protein
MPVTPSNLTALLLLPTSLNGGGARVGQELYGSNALRRPLPPGPQRPSSPPDPSNGGGGARVGQELCGFNAQANLLQRATAPPDASLLSKRPPPPSDGANGGGARVGQELYGANSTCLNALNAQRPPPPSSYAPRPTPPLPAGVLPAYIPAPAPIYLICLSRDRR